MGVFWLVMGLVLAGLLLVAWLMDRAGRRRGARISSGADVAWQARESRRDAEILGNPYNQDVSWSSWSRRNHPKR
ncbi:hypothetical protein [Modestobacter roseus]|uniref:Uncharacterized protein n=1 Tax=Modestobacter roseus TaxID=1181884 RepID=A0A562IWS5_9ACTN|nr:hypothetical protein [Modestobacter roseus]MQA36089.1 hypothetical protein [Modestobacter roseus]TWH75055.1 hypothetical protein JD78_03606 [Modestobacter roseus]